MAIHTQDSQIGGINSAAPHPPKVIQLIDALITELTKLRKAAEPRDPTIILKVEDDLKTHPGASRSEIASRTHIEPRAISRAVERLEAKGRAIKVGSRRGTRWFWTESLSNLRHHIRKLQ